MSRFESLSHLDAILSILIPLRDRIHVFIMRHCYLLFLAPILKIVAKPLQAAPISARNNDFRSEFDLKDTRPGQNTPGLLFPIPVQYTDIETSNTFESAPLLDLGTNVIPESNRDISGVHPDISNLPFSRPVTNAGLKGVEIAEWPDAPYCPMEFAYCCTGDYAPETNKYLDGCSSCMFFSFLFSISPVCCTND